MSVREWGGRGGHCSSVMCLILGSDGGVVAALPMIFGFLDWIIGSAVSSSLAKVIIPVVFSIIYNCSEKCPI